MTNHSHIIAEFSSRGGLSTGQFFLPRDSCDTTRVLHRKNEHLARTDEKWHDSGMSPRFLTLTDVAEILNLTPSAARSLVNSGELPAIQVGGKKAWRIEDTVLEQYIQDQYAATRERVKSAQLD